MTIGLWLSVALAVVAIAISIRNWRCAKRTEDLIEQHRQKRERLRRWVEDA